MCYYNGQKIIRSEYIRLKEVTKTVANYDFLNRDIVIGFDYGNSAVLKANTKKNDFDIVAMEWGFIPHYIPNRAELLKFRLGFKNANGQYKPPTITLNAIGEELLRKVTFKKAALHSRCLVLSTGFFEWRHVHPLSARTGKPLKTPKKYPYHIRLRDKEYFFMAGIWQPWTDKETGEYVESFAIVTTRANKLMSQIHNSRMRMPSILTEELAYEWLFGALDTEKITEVATHQIASEKMEAFPISKDFLSQIDPLEEMDYKELSALEY